MSRCQSILRSMLMTLVGMGLLAAIITMAAWAAIAAEIAKKVLLGR